MAQIDINADIDTIHYLNRVRRSVASTGAAERKLDRGRVPTYERSCAHDDIYSTEVAVAQVIRHIDGKSAIHIARQ